MPLVLYYRPSFERSLKKLGASQKKIVATILECLQIYYDSGCNLDIVMKKNSRFFYKQLQRPYYEAGIEYSIRVVLRREGQKCIAILAGNHDQIKQFLSSV